MGFITAAQMGAFFPERTKSTAGVFDTTTIPTAVQVEAYIEDVTAEIDGLLLSVGIDGSNFRDNAYLKLVCKKGVACLIEKGILARTKDGFIVSAYCPDYQKMLEKLVDDPGVIGQANTGGILSTGGGFGDPDFGFKDRIV